MRSITRLRLLGDRLIVKMGQPHDRRVVTSESGEKVTIFYPNADAIAEEQEYHVWSEVIQVGPGRWATKKGWPLNKRVPIAGVKVGDRVLVIRYVADVHTNKVIQHLLPEDHVIIRENDIIVVDPRDEAAA